MNPEMLTLVLFVAAGLIGIIGFMLSFLLSQIAVRLKEMNETIGSIDKKLAVVMERVDSQEKRLHRLESVAALH